LGNTLAPARSAKKRREKLWRAARIFGMKQYGMLLAALSEINYGEMPSKI
jgi:hypothetical protein